MRPRNLEHEAKEREGRCKHDCAHCPVPVTSMSGNVDGTILRLCVEHIVLFLEVKEVFHVAPCVLNIHLIALKKGRMVCVEARGNCGRGGYLTLVLVQGRSPPGRLTRDKRHLLFRFSLFHFPEGSCGID